MHCVKLRKKIILVNLHVTFCVNSFAHWKGFRPFNKKILPVNNHLVSLISMGEGYHNYHHVFEYDYKTSETLFCINPTGWVIWSLSKCGLASNLKKAPSTRIRKLKLRFN